MKLKFSILVMASILVMGSCSTEEQGMNEELVTASLKASKVTADVFNPISGMVMGKATLHRNASGITMNYKTTGLIPGHAYTIWWVIWNRPENCDGPCDEPDFFIADQVEVDVLYAAGHVVGASGKGNFSGTLKAGDDSESINELFLLPPAGGLQEGNTLKAEVHLVLRSHGPAIPGMVNDQIGSYEGGCVDPFAIAPFTEIPDEEGECGDIEFAIFLPVE